MTQKDRSKELWLIPKRVNLHQTICLIDAIIERKYDGTSWNPQKQNNLGANLKKWGATKNGKNISPQAIRTLVALPQYLGFVYVNTKTTPNTICLTEAGKALWKKHKDNLRKIPNLTDGGDLLISESDKVLIQMEKLQITNPIIQKDCQNIFIFPFRFMLKVLIEVGYLDKEEIAFFLFRKRNEDELSVIVQEINNFRKLSFEARKSLIDSFKATHIGNITLVAAPSSGYYIALCQITGIIEKITVKPSNKKEKITAIRIKDNYLGYVNDILTKKYSKAEVYNFEGNLNLWIDYIGTPERIFPPIGITLNNTTNQDYLIRIIKDNNCVYDDMIGPQSNKKYPMFVGEKYEIELINISTWNQLPRYIITPDFSKREFDLEISTPKDDKPSKKVEDIAKQIIAHCEASNFEEETLNRLRIIAKITGIDKTTDKSLRGAYLEFFFYTLLSKLKGENVIDEVVWNGSIGKYELPSPAPGGKTGSPDIIFVIDKRYFVLELTTIKAKSLQFSSEGASVPDHIRLYKERTSNNVIGLFCAPIISERNKQSMLSTIKNYGIKLNCINTVDLLNILLTKDRKIIINNLE